MKMQIVYKPEAADRQEWVVDRHNPAWPIIEDTENATGWGWLEFIERLDGMSAKAWRALIWALRRDAGERVRLEHVTIEDWNDLDLRVQCPACEEWVSPQGIHECMLPEPEVDDEAEPEEKAGDDPEA